MVPITTPAPETPTTTKSQIHLPALSPASRVSASRPKSQTGDHACPGAFKPLPERPPSVSYLVLKCQGGDACARQDRAAARAKVLYETPVFTFCFFQARGFAATPSLPHVSQTQV